MLYYKYKELAGKTEEWMVELMKDLKRDIVKERGKITPIPAGKYPDIYALAFKYNEVALHNFFLLCGRLKGINPYKLSQEDMDRLEGAYGYYLGDFNPELAGWTD